MTFGVNKACRPGMKAIHVITVPLKSGCPRMFKMLSLGSVVMPGEYGCFNNVPFMMIFQRMNSASEFSHLNRATSPAITLTE